MLPVEQEHQGAPCIVSQARSLRGRAEWARHRHFNSFQLLLAALVEVLLRKAEREGERGEEREEKNRRGRGAVHLTKVRYTTHIDNHDACIYAAVLHHQVARVPCICITYV